MRQMTKLEIEHSLFDKARNEYRKWAEEEFTPTQRIVSVRIDASYALRDSVKPHGTKDQLGCYRAYLRLVDAWFTYEALLNWAAEAGATTQGSAKPGKLAKGRFSTNAMSDIVTDFYADLETVFTKPNRRAGLGAYVEKLGNYPGTSRTQKDHLAAFRRDIQKTTPSTDNYSRILAFAYAIRNAYAHNGETARTGTNHYVAKLTILDAAFVAVLRIVLRVATNIYRDLCDEIS